jgi:hypothetical protein
MEAISTDEEILIDAEAYLTVAHIRCAPTVHVRRLEISGGQTKVGELDDNLALAAAINLSEPIRDDKVFRFYVAVEDLLGVASRDGITHLGKHGRN